MKSYNYQNAGTLTLTTTGNIDDLDIQGCGTVLMNNALSSTVRGIKAGYPGQTVNFISIGAGEVDFAHQNTGSSANNRLINFVTSGITPLAPSSGNCLYQYDEVTARWRLVNHNQGASITVPFNSGNFTTGGGTPGTWTVIAANQITYQYYIRGNLCLMDFFIQLTSLSATPQHLDLAIPNSWTSSTHSKRQVIEVIDAGVGIFGFISTNFTSNTVLSVFRDSSAANWSASTNTTYVLGSIEFSLN